MGLRASLLTALVLLLQQPGPLAAREAVDASAPAKVAVTIYRDPERSEDQSMDTRFPKGFAMISETRTVTLPAGESTIRFTGVAEGMVAVSAIVTGLPGGTIEKNRNADLLSPAALVDGTLGNRVRITRTNPATGAARSEQAIVRTRADGGLVLQTDAGYEAVRCSGLPEGLTFDRVPAGLSAQPVYSVDTRSDTGGTYSVTLTYLAWGFDWQAHYVATLDEAGARGKVGLHLTSWLTLLNDNGQSFPDAELMAVAGTLSIESDFEDLSDPPVARPLRLTCFPIGSTAAGSPVPDYDPAIYPAPPPAAMMAPMMEADGIVVTGSRISARAVASKAAIMAQEEQLGDLKLYRVPEPITVNAKGLKQVAFLDKPSVKGEYLYELRCEPWGYNYLFGDSGWDLQPARILLETVNDEKHGLGVALPTGGLTVFEPSERGDQLVAQDRLRDYAKGQDVELSLGESRQVFGACGRQAEEKPEDAGAWHTVGARISNALSAPVRIRFKLGGTVDWQARQGRKALKTKDGEYILEVRLDPGEERDVRWQIKSNDKI